MSKVRPPSDTSEAAIFARLWEGRSGGLTVPLARHIVKLRFVEADVARINELARRNQDGRLTPAELSELDNFVRVGDLLAILQSKARKRLREGSSRNGHG
jgi:hypothetical protein